MTKISQRARRRVRIRAWGCCEYCLAQERLVGQKFTIDHIIPRSKGGTDLLDNLCLCCPICNTTKSNKTSALDSHTGQLVPLYHPRRDRWDKHFRWSHAGVRIMGQTPVGRATVKALKLNRRSLTWARRFWAKHGAHPPQPR